jgi:hypothetical protein
MCIIRSPSCTWKNFQRLTLCFSNASTDSPPATIFSHCRCHWNSSVRGGVLTPCMVCFPFPSFYALFICFSSPECMVCGGVLTPSMVCFPLPAFYAPFICFICINWLLRLYSRIYVIKICKMHQSETCRKIKSVNVIQVRAIKLDPYLKVLCLVY